MRLIEWYKDGALTWRNPFALEFYMILLSIISGIIYYCCDYTPQIIMSIYIAIWTFTCLLTLFVIAGEISFINERKKYKNDGQNGSELKSISDKLSEAEWIKLYREFNKFKAKVNKLISVQFNASSDENDIMQFADRLFEEYQIAGMPKDAAQWISLRLKKEFMYVHEPPRWIESKPAWPFFNGNPMIFISQTSLSENPTTTEYFIGIQEVYLFGIRIYKNDKLEMKYTVVTQSQEPGTPIKQLRKSPVGA